MNISFPNNKIEAIEKWLDIIKSFASYSGSANYKAKTILQKGINKICNSFNSLNVYYDISSASENDNLTPMKKYSLDVSLDERFCLLAKSLSLYNTQKQEPVINYIK